MIILLHALEQAVAHSTPKPVALILNYPSNPTALVADLDFYAQVVDFCKRHSIWILSDLAYSEIYFDGNPPPSILQVPGAKDIAVEFTSMSKTYSMPWLAYWVRRREPIFDWRADPHKILFGLWRVYAHSSCSCSSTQRTAGLRRRN